MKTSLKFLFSLIFCIFFVSISVKAATIVGENITTDGNIGIGIAVPTAQLNVVGLTPDTNQFLVKAASEQSANIMQINNSADLGLLTLSSEGNLGIGTSTPTKKLHVVVRNGYEYNPSINTAIFQRSLYSSDGANVGIISGFKGEAKLTLGDTQDEYKGGMSYSNYNWGSQRESLSLISNGVQSLVINYLGNVGVGVGHGNTNSPNAKFQVIQHTTGRGTVSVSEGGTVWTGVDTQFLDTFNVGDTITAAGQTLTIEAIASNTSLTTNPVGDAITDEVYTLVGGRRFSVFGNGKVGIGTTEPVATLDVNGYMRLNKNTSAPAVCTADNDGAISLTSTYITCVCNGTSSTWVYTSDGTTPCVWE
jgi:hypothetical protein